MTPIGMIFHIKKTPAETNGQSLEMEWELLPKADGSPVHIHPFLGMLTKKYKEETVTVNPPNFIVSVLNAIGKMRGFKVS